MPPSVLERLSEIFSKKRVMTSKTLPLFLRPDRDDLVVHDAAYLEERDYEHIFAVMPGVKRLVLGNACQFKVRSPSAMHFGSGRWPLSRPVLTR